MTARRLVLLLVALAPAAALAAAAPASGAARRTPRAAVPAANFLVEWRIEPVAAAPPANGGFTVGTRDAASGRSGFGPGAVVTGTARSAAPQGVRVANGKEAALQFDDARRRMVYDMAWSGQADASSQPASGVAGHEVTLHRIDGLRVTPHWTHGDSLALDLELTRTGPGADGDESSARAIGLRSTVQLSFDEWQGVARVGDDQELQVRVRWR